jgi:uncharacterized repeat protein (TIGR03803 family)
MRRSFLSSFVFILSCGFALAQAQYKGLWNFGGAGDGISPKGTLVADAAGNLYGTTPYGGAGGNCANYCGTVYELSPSANGWTETVLYTFCYQANCTDGADPWAGLILDHSGNLYRTTIAGGTGLLGTVFELSPPAQTGGAWTQQTPWSALIADKAGNLYGLAGVGGAYNKGVVFGIAP